MQTIYLCCFLLSRLIIFGDGSLIDKGKVYFKGDEVKYACIENGVVEVNLRQGYYECFLCLDEYQKPIKIYISDFKGEQRLYFEKEEVIVEDKMLFKSYLSMLLLLSLILANYFLYHYYHQSDNCDN